MRVAIVGAPKTGKTKLLKKSFSDINPSFDNIPQNLTKRSELAIGFPSDYRTEMILAGERLEKMIKSFNYDDCVFTSTILDSLAYARVRQLVDEEVQNDQFLMGRTMALIDIIYHAMLNTFKFDKVIFLPYTGKDEKSLLISGALQECMDHFEVKYENNVQESE